MNTPYPNAYPNPYNSKQEIVKVNGEPGARAYQMPPNSSALLLDESNPLVWLVQSDGAGYKTVSAYTIAPVATEKPQNSLELEARITKLEEQINDLKSNYTGNKQSKKTNE